MSECQNFFHEKLDILDKYIKLNKNETKIIYLKRSRENNTHANKAFMTLNINNLETIALARLYFSSLKWNDDDRVMCFWAKKRINEWVKSSIYNLKKK